MKKVALSKKEFQVVLTAIICKLEMPELVKVFNFLDEINPNKAQPNEASRE